jgi:hypothetical protein
MNSQLTCSGYKVSRQTHDDAHPTVGNLLSNPSESNGRVYNPLSRQDPLSFGEGVGSEETPYGDHAVNILAGDGFILYISRLTRK